MALLFTVILLWFHFENDDFLTATVFFNNGSYFCTFDVWCAYFIANQQNFVKYDFLFRFGR